jgi:hypothetical protein
MAIAFDAGSYVSANDTSATFSHTTSGADRILLVMTMHGGTTTQNVTGVTFNGVALTKVADFYENSSSSCSAWWYLINPDIGTHNVVVSLSASRAIRAIAVSYTGAKQSAQPDAHTEASNTGDNATVTLSTTTVDDNCIVVMGGRTATGQNLTASTNVTKRQGADFDFMIVGDNNTPKTPAGAISQSMTCDVGTEKTRGEYGTFSIAPAVAVANTSNFFNFI